MNIKNFKLTGKVIALGLASAFIYSCTDPKPTQENDDNLPDTDTVKAMALNVGGELFSVPSPIQTALLVKKSGVAYDKTILNPGNKNGQYVSEFTKALNLGVYGADLGYVSIYSQTQDALVYLGAVKKIADKLGITAAFDKQTLDRINNNISNKDSILTLVGIAYRASDAYLKTNKRTEISSLILTGGWIESMYFCVNTYNKKPTNEIKYRIAEQKQALKSILKLIYSHNLPGAKDLIKDLEDLSKTYEGITTKYIYVEPTTDESKKITYINSTTEIVVSKEQLDQITKQLTAIREKIINAKS